MNWTDQLDARSAVLFGSQKWDRIIWEWGKQLLAIEKQLAGDEVIFGGDHVAGGGVIELKTGAEPFGVVRISPMGSVGGPGLESGPVEYIRDLKADKFIAAMRVKIPSGDDFTMATMGLALAGNFGDQGIYFGRLTSVPDDDKFAIRIKKSTGGNQAVSTVSWADGAYHDLVVEHDVLAAQVRFVVDDTAPVTLTDVNLPVQRGTAFAEIGNLSTAASRSLLIARGYFSFPIS